MAVQASLENLLLEQAAQALESGSRFQFRQDVLGGPDGVQRMLVMLSMRLGHNVRAHGGDGLVTVYDEDNDDNLSVVVAMVGYESTSR